MSVGTIVLVVVLVVAAEVVFARRVDGLIEGV